MFNAMETPGLLVKRRISATTYPMFMTFITALIVARTMTIVRAAPDSSIRSIALLVISIADESA